MSIPLFLGLAVTFSCAWTVFAYPGIAAARGWPTGALLIRPFSWLQAIAYCGILGAPAIAWRLGTWRFALAVVAVAFFFVPALLTAFGPRCQVIIGLGLIAGTTTSVLMLL
jgi:hypothetical protein